MDDDSPPCLVLETGATFPSKEAFQLAVFARQKDEGRRKPKILGSDAKRCTLVCSGDVDDCPFKVIVRLDVNLVKWRVTTCSLEHGQNCDDDIYNSHIPTKLVAHGLNASNFALSRSSHVTHACE